jgi:hypothetical protein
MVLKAKVHLANLADREGARVMLERVSESFWGLAVVGGRRVPRSGPRRWITGQLGLSCETVQRKPRWVWCQTMSRSIPYPRASKGSASGG